MPEAMAENITWDLSDLYSSLDDPRITADLETARQKTLTFESLYKPLLEKLVLGQAADLPMAKLLKEYKDIVTQLTRPSVYSHLSFAENTQDPAIGAFLQKIQVTLTEIQTHLVFFEVLWNKLDEKICSKILEDKALAKDLHFLKKMRIWAPHTLNESEEKIMALKSNTSGRAFSRLFDETLNNIEFFITENGKRVKKTEGEVLSLLHSPDRSQRQMASENLAEGLSKHSRLLTYIFNMILADHRLDLKIRNFKHPMDSMNLSNEIGLESVLNLVKTVKNAYPLAQRYYALKKHLLNLPDFYDYDRYAPIDNDRTAVSFEDCQDIVMSGYNAFSEDAGKIVEQFFTKRWIDAEVREGKQGGGFACQTTPELHPYILVNYTGNIRDVMTVAHELGHGLHQCLSAEAGILESSAPLTMAETASVFGEMLIFEKILEKETDPAKRLSLICGKIDDNFATVFRQIAMTDFEMLAHQAGLDEGELSNERLSDLWIQANASLYGKSVTLTKAYRHGWMYIPHFIHSPFYCYAYAFAQLFVLSLYQKYKENKASFVPNYFAMLKLGGSKAPQEIALMAGLNISDPKFWLGGLQLLENLVAEAEKLSGKKV